MEPVSLAYDEYAEDDTDPHACPIVLIHGYLWNKFMFKPLALNTCKSTQRRVYCLDMRCHGQSPRTNDLDIYLMVADVKKFLKDHDLEKVIFMCHSFSCSIVYLLTLDQPESVDRMIMIDHPPFRDYYEAFNQKVVYPQFSVPLRMLTSLDSKMSLAQAKRKLFEQSKMSTETSQKIFLKKTAHDLVKQDGKFKYSLDLEFLRERFKVKAFDPEPRGRSDHDILIIRCNDSDRVTDEKFVAVKKYNPHCKLVTIRNTTHLLMFEEMELFLSVVKKYLNGEHPDQDHIIIN